MQTIHAWCWLRRGWVTVPVYPHTPTFLGPESPAGVPTPPLQILPPARDHLHFSGRKARQEYQHRHCRYCHQQGILGEETHIFLKCPATANLIEETAVQINKKLRLFDALTWSPFTDTKRVSILLGNPPSLLKKYMKEWMQECVPLFHTYTTKLRSLLVTLFPPPPSESEDGASDDAS